MMVFIKAPAHHRVAVSDLSSPGDLTVTFYTTLAKLPSAPVIDSWIDWGRFSFGRLGPIVTVAPTFRDPPLPEEKADKELTSLIMDNGDGESGAENT